MHLGMYQASPPFKFINKHVDIIIYHKGLGGHMASYMYVAHKARDL